MFQVVGCLASADEFVPNDVPVDMVEAVLDGITDDELNTLHAEVLSDVFETEEEAWFHIDFWVGGVQYMTEGRDWQTCEYDADDRTLKFVRIKQVDA